ncbi:PREDICTED: arginine/serine-rich coiled-coil protein 2 isoform X2 [Nelumbo nucifera]|uniref:Arginine/serine-rich coiled-coil protein 2 isoform X2 n=1 Tax=Nelumbo nucifera TaxID=4432 RepID=A0A1U8B6E8_NELNU|nr:PREDICTED: arginine/serine-rich coiled-coil protein 2 isoform X2 [Nelumbo nucifera]
MESNAQSQSQDNADKKPSFRKPSNDAANRKYRRRSPGSGSASSSSDGSPKRGRSRSPVYSREEPTKVSDDRRRRRDDGREIEVDPARGRYGKDSDAYRHSDRQSYGSSRDYRRHDDYSRHKYTSEGERSYQRLSSRSGREPRGDSRADNTRHESEHDKLRDYGWHVDKHSLHKPDADRHRIKDKEREAMDLEHPKYKGKDSTTDRTVSGRRHANSNMEETKMGDWDRHNRDRGGRDDKRDYKRSLVDHKNDQTSYHGEYRGHGKDSTTERDDGGISLRETQKSNSKELERERNAATEKRKNDGKDTERPKERYDRESEEHFKSDSRNSGYRPRDVVNEQYQDKEIRANLDEESSKKLKLFNSDTGSGSAKEGQSVAKSSTSSSDGRLSSTSKQVQEIADKISEHAHSSAGEAEAAHDLNAAKVAAMKAAELVNRNLISGGYMTTDQKKKLLWGNKKNSNTEESSHRWDMAQFSDRERQEKFNKLMGVKGESKVDHKQDEKDGGALLRAEKQKELQLDLEKQYTAGLRRRDGRTVGLGL